jgi:hypothetical protein
MPGFQDSDAGNYELMATSECVDQAQPHALVWEDFKGVRRPQGAQYDFGAYENVTEE